MKTDTDDFTYRMFAWNKPVERIDFNGRFPAADLNYIDSNLSCKVAMRVVSPFVPHNSDVSSTPGFYIDFTVENPTADTVEISLLGALEPNFANKKEGNKSSLEYVGNGFGVFIQLEKDCVEKWRIILEKGKESLESKLWNGEYYNLWINRNETDESLMTDQLDGEWFLRMMGMNGNLSDKRIRRIIEKIFKKNFDKEQGLVNATCFENRKTTVHTYKNCQAGAVWTGIGYAFSALALSVGLNEIADTVVDSIQENQLRLGCFWDHWECEHHYSRPMSSWSTLHAVSGLTVDYENKTLSFKPLNQNITFPLFIQGIIAKVKYVDGIFNIECIEGDLSEWKITVK